MIFKGFFTFVLVIVVTCTVYLSVGSDTNFCRDDFRFFSLDQCKESCYNFSIKPLNESANDNDDLPDYSDDDDDITYKSIFLTENEFNMTNETIQSAVFGNFSPEDYFIKGNVTAVCIPVNLGDCSKQVHQVEKFVLNKDTREVWIEKYERSYSFDEYVITRYNELLICEPYPESLLIWEIGIFASPIFLAIALIVSLSLRSLRSDRNWPLITHIAMLFLGYTSFLIKRYLNNEVYRHCLPVALLQQFFMLSAFFWVNVQAIVIHSAFTRLHSTTSSSTKTKYRKFLLFGAFAWGIALIIMLGTLTAELINGSVINPKFASNCWFHMDERTAILFYHGPMALSLLLNFALFIHVVIHVKKLADDASAVNKKAHKQLFCLAIKLVFILGFCWIIKIVFWFYGRFNGVLVYLDVITTYQGVFISLAVLANATVIKAVKSFCLNIWSKRKAGLKSQGDIDMSVQTVVTTSDSISSK